MRARKIKGNNVFVSFLDSLKVKHTEKFSNRYFNENPHKYDLFGLSNMLLDYGVQNAAIEISDKEKDITAIKTPFIAHFGSDFVIVDKVGFDHVSFIWKGVRHDLPTPKFIQSWTGIALLAEVSEISIQPDYKAHRKVELLDLSKQIAFFFACGLIAVVSYINRENYKNVGISLLVLVNLLGVYICWLLLLKQMHIQNENADKICSLFKKKECNNVLESKASKFFGIISYCEIGLGYFSINVLLLLLSPALNTSIAFLNILTQPFTVWSLWYQRSKAKQWCPFCLIVVVILWTLFIINFLFGFIQLPGKNIFQFLIFNPHFISVLSYYLIFVLGINLLSPQLNSERVIQSLRQSMNSLKEDKDVFLTLLKKQPFYETSNCNSVIRFGNTNSKLRITILINPYCNPCSKIHTQIEELLKKVKNNISVQYVLSSFGEKFNSTNRYLIAACLANTSTQQTSYENADMKVFNEWFKNGIAFRDDYFKDMGLDIENPKIKIEFKKHEGWKLKNNIKFTPFVLINGFRLPKSYKIEDLRYFIDLNI